MVFRDNHMFFSLKLLIYSLNNLCHRHLLSTYYVPGIVFCAGDTPMIVPTVPAHEDLVFYILEPQ